MCGKNVKFSLKFRQSYPPFGTFLALNNLSMSKFMMIKGPLKGWGPIVKLLPLVDSFLLSTNEKLLFFPKHIQLVPKHCFLILIFFIRVTGTEILAKTIAGGQVE